MDMSTTVYCHGPDEVCSRCGAPLMAPNQICAAPEPLTRRDWRIVLQSVEARIPYLERRAARPSSYVDGYDANDLRLLQDTLPTLRRAAGGHGGEPDEVVELDKQPTQRAWRLMAEALAQSNEFHESRLARQRELAEVIEAVAGIVR